MEKEMKKDERIAILLRKGLEAFGKPHLKWTDDPAANDLILDIENHPHAFVLGCVMDKQIKEERAWRIPYAVSKIAGGFGMEDLLKLGPEDLKGIFSSEKLHRFNNEMAKNFHSAVRRIHGLYSDDASKIWADRPKSAAVVRRFLQFEGVGVKIATAAANALARDFGIPFEDLSCVDLSPDVHVRRVFNRLGFTENPDSTDELVYAARELNPEYPGVFDLPCFEIGKRWCRPKNPKCEECYLAGVCPKNGL